MSRADDIALWHDVNRTIIGLPSAGRGLRRRSVP